MLVKPALAIAVLLTSLLFMSLAYSAPDFDKLLKSLTQRWGVAASAKFNGWRTTVQESSSQPEAEQLRRINEYFNRNIAFQDDQQVWNQSDYWASPLESLGRGAGDCEDFAIAKYFSLRMLGVSPEKLRLTYVKAKIGGASSTVTQAHMVLAYYTQPDAEPQVLDNLISDIRPASRRPDLIPVFSFNAEGLWVGGAQPQSSVDRLSRWKDLLLRMRAEGFEL